MGVSLCLDSSARAGSGGILCGPFACRCAASIVVATQRIYVGVIYSGKVVTVTVCDPQVPAQYRRETVGTVPRTAGSEIRRCKACATKTRPRPHGS